MSLNELEVIVIGAPTERASEMAERQRSAVMACVASAPTRFAQPAIWLARPSARQRA
jgi:hypothetical protein